MARAPVIYVTPADTLPAGAAKIDANFVLCDADSATIVTHTGSIATNTTNITALQSSVAAISPIALVINSTASADCTTNTNLIQAALTAGGVVNITQAGTIYINATLVVGSNTMLLQGPKTVIRMAPNTNLACLTTSAALSYLAGGVAVTLALTTNTTTLTVTWTAHGLSVGQVINIAGVTTPTTYNGVFRVMSVVDANNVTVSLPNYPAAGVTTVTGSPIAWVACQNVQIIGGTYNYDYPNNTSGTNYNVHSMLLFGLADSYVEGVNSIGAAKFNFNVQNCLNLRVNACTANGRSDAMKIYGPSRDIVVDGLAGTSGDDGLSIQNIEGTGFTYAMVNQGGGDVTKITVKNLGVQATAVAAFHLYGIAGYLTDDILVDTVDAPQANNVQGVVIGGGTGTQGVAGLVTLRRLNAPNSGTGTLSLANIYVDTLMIEDCTVNWESTVTTSTAAWCVTSLTFSCNNLIIKRLHSNGSPTSGAGYINLFAPGGTFVVNQWVFEDCMVKNGYNAATINLIAVQTASQIGQVIVNRGYFDSSCKSLLYFAVAPTSGGNMILSDVTWLGGSILQGNTMNCTVIFKGTTLGTNSQAVFRMTNNCTVVIKSDGTNNFGSGTFYGILSGTHIVTCYGNDISYDAGLLATTKGQYFTHASAVAGRNAANQQGPCIAVDGTHFYALGTGTSGVNTLIV